MNSVSFMGVSINEISIIFKIAVLMILQQNRFFKSLPFTAFDFAGFEGEIPLKQITVSNHKYCGDHFGNSGPKEKHLNK